MKTRILNLMSLCILSLVLMVSFVSAASLSDITQYTIPTNTSHDSSVQIVFNLTNSGDADTIDWGNSSFTSAQTGLTFSFDDSSIADGNSPAVTETITATINFDDHQTGTITGIINATPTAGNEKTLAFSVIILDSSEISVTSATIAEGETSTNITVTNEGNVALTGINLSSTGDFDVNFSTNDFNLAAGASSSITVTSTEDLNDLLGTEPSVTITATADDTAGTSDTGTISPIILFCEDVANPGELDITIADLSVSQGFGDDGLGTNDYWYPFDIIEAEIEITNDGDWDIENIELSWELYTTAGKKITDDTESDFNLDEDEDQDIILTFALDENIDDMEGENLILYVKALGNIDDNDADDEDGKDTCDSTSHEVDLISNDDFVVVDGIKMGGLLVEDLRLDSPLFCGADVQVVADVWNIGDDDQDDVVVVVLNNELGISKEITIGDMNAMDSEKLETTISIPVDAEAKEYTLSFMIYDEDNDIFETSEDDEAIFNVRFTVGGNCYVENSASITAALTSEAQSGEELTVKTTIKNTESTVATYNINVDSYENWATLTSVQDDLTLVAGESRDITLTFDVKKGVSGSKTFNVEAVSDSNSITTQPVSVSIAAQKSLFSGIKLPENNKYLWGIGALNALLILAIIIVAIRLSKE